MVERENVMLTMRRGHIEGTENKIDARLCVGVCFPPMTKAIFHNVGKTCCTRRKIIQGVVVGGREQRDLEVTIGQLIRVMPNTHKQRPCMRTAVSKSLHKSLSFRRHGPLRPRRLHPAITQETTSPRGTATRDMRKDKRSAHARVERCAR